jgi:hypothetical protein
MRSVYQLEMKRSSLCAANAARQMRHSWGILFIDKVKNSLFGLNDAAFAALAARYILNVRNTLFLPLSPDN